MLAVGLEPTPDGLKARGSAFELRQRQYRELDSNQHYRVQSAASYRWTIPMRQYGEVDSNHHAPASKAGGLPLADPRPRDSSGGWSRTSTSLFNRELPYR